MFVCTTMAKAFGVKGAFWLPVVGEVGGHGEGIPPPLSILKNALANEIKESQS